jgi:hypothetical protein
MKSARAEALRLILPLLFRLATVDFFGTDDLRDLVEVVLGFDDVLRDRVDDDDREDDRSAFLCRNLQRQQKSESGERDSNTLEHVHTFLWVWDYRAFNG